MRVARRYQPLLVNTVVGFIGPEYLYDGKQIIRAGLEDHFCGKLLGLPMGCDVCYTNHAEADQDDMDTLLMLLGAAGVNFIMGVPGADDVMLNYQSTSFHDALFLRETAGPEARARVRGLAAAHADHRRRGPAAAALVQPPAGRHERARGVAQMSRRAAPRRIPQRAARRCSMSKDTVTPSPWRDWRQATPARIALGRAGAGMPTDEVLRFGWAHALARDAVHAALDVPALEAQLRAARLGRRAGAQPRAGPHELSAAARPGPAARCRRCAGPAGAGPTRSSELCIVIGDGLSSLAVARHAVPLLAALQPHCRPSFASRPS